MPTPQLVLLVGAPRSGTTWLQSMLGSHPAIATPQETDLFSRYVRPLHEAWAWQLRGTPEDWERRRFKGLPGVLDAAEFRHLVRAGIDRVLEAVQTIAPEAQVVLEKSPSHSLCSDVVADYAPDARVIHIVRDGRDVAASLTAAGGSWGREWAPRDLGAATRSWVRHVQGAREYRLIGFRYREVRYESLVAADASVLAELFDFVGVPVDEQGCAALFERFSASRMRDGAENPIVVGGEFAAAVSGRVEPEGFFGSGGGGWVEQWDANDRLLVQAIAGAELERLGYVTDGSWAAGPGRTAAYYAERAARRALASLAHRVGRAGTRVAGETP